MPYSSHHKVLHDHLFMNLLVKRVKFAKDLGVIFYNKLPFDKHINNMVNNVLIMLGLING